MTEELTPYVNYLKAFLKDAPWEVAMDRMERHCDMLEEACKKVRRN